MLPYWIQMEASITRPLRNQLALTTNQVEGGTKPPSEIILQSDSLLRVRSFFQVMTPYKYLQIMLRPLVVISPLNGRTELILDFPGMVARTEEPKLREIMPKTF